MDLNNILSMLGSNPQLASSLMQMIGGGGGNMDMQSIMNILPQMMGQNSAAPVTPTPQPTSTKEQEFDSQEVNYTLFQMSQE